MTKGDPKDDKIKDLDEIEEPGNQELDDEEKKDKNLEEEEDKADPDSLFDDADSEDYDEGV